MDRQASDHLNDFDTALSRGLHFTRARWHFQTSHFLLTKKRLVQPYVVMNYTVFFIFICIKLSPQVLRSPGTTLICFSVYLKYFHSPSAPRSFDGTNAVPEGVGRGCWHPLLSCTSSPQCRIYVPTAMNSVHAQTAMDGAKEILPIDFQTMDDRDHQQEGRGHAI